MKIGILSDSHSDILHTRLLVDKLIEEGAEYLIHAGDIVHEENLAAMGRSAKPQVAVFGNNDSHLHHLGQHYPIFKEPYFFKIKALRFKLMHLPYYLSPGDEDITIYGHTHLAKFQYQNGKLIINPGEVCARESGKHEAILLEVTDTHYHIHHHYKMRGTEEFVKETTVYER